MNPQPLPPLLTPVMMLRRLFNRECDILEEVFGDEVKITDLFPQHEN